MVLKNMFADVLVSVNRPQFQRFEMVEFYICEQYDIKLKNNTIPYSPSLFVHIQHPSTGIEPSCLICHV